MSPESMQTNEAARPRNKKALDASAEVIRILEAYMEELDRGGRINPEELAAERPELAEPLRQCLASLEFLQSAAMSLRGGSPSPKAPTTYAGAPAGQLGDFRILREIGRGGMGVVYVRLVRPVRHVRQVRPVRHVRQPPPSRNRRNRRQQRKRQATASPAARRTIVPRPPSAAAPNTQPNHNNRFIQNARICPLARSS
jgi:hypothetical protein